MSIDHDLHDYLIAMSRSDRPAQGLGGAFRQGRRLLLLDLQRHRRAPSPGRPNPKVHRRREHVLQDLTEIRRHGQRAAAVVDKVCRHCEGTGNGGHSRSRSIAMAVGSHDGLERLAGGLLDAAMPLPKAVRPLGCVAVRTSKRSGRRAAARPGDLT